MTAAGDRVLVGLAEDLEAAVRHPGGTCWYPTLIQTLHPEDAAVLEAAMASGVSSGVLSIVLRKRGIEIGSVSIQRHRRGACKCPR